MNSHDEMSRREFLRGKAFRGLVGFAISGLEKGVTSLGIVDGAEVSSPSAHKAGAATQLPVMRLDDARQHSRDTRKNNALQGEARAFVNRQHCLAWMNSPCSSCREHCPEPGAIVVEAGRPTVVTEKCTGCRACYDVCPAPVNAIMILPRPQRRSVRG